MRAAIADIALPDTAEGLVRAAMASYGRLDAVVNNAGIGGPSGDLDSVSMDDVVHTLDVNLLGPVRLCRAAIPHLKARGSGRIVNLGSLFADQPVVGGSAYIMSKAAIRSLTHCLALELGPNGITVNTVAPGFMMTRMTRRRSPRRRERRESTRPNECCSCATPFRCADTVMVTTSQAPLHGCCPTTPRT